jgi:hypothetical protein
MARDSWTVRVPLAIVQEWMLMGPEGNPASVGPDVGPDVEVIMRCIPTDQLPEVTQSAAICDTSTKRTARP